MRPAPTLRGAPRAYWANAGDTATPAAPAARSRTSRSRARAG
jgi:hypothetical protein